MAVENSGCDRRSDEDEKLKKEILELKKIRNAVVMAHYYQRGEIQELADYIGDSLALARIATTVEAPVIVLCGVHFMGETAKILCREKTVLVPDLEAGCSLADSCPAEDFAKFVAEHPGHTVVSYVNTSAAVKAHTDIVVTSGNARQIIESLPADKPIVFGPDRNLGNYINSVTGRDMVLWDGACHVHEKFSTEKLVQLKAEHPDAEVLVHPECKKPLRLLADKIGSTAALLKHAKESECEKFIVATESGILHEMTKQCPGKTFIPAPPDDSTCGCNDCNFMKLNTLEKLRNCLRDLSPAIEIDSELIEKARRPIDAMLELSAQLSI